MPSCLQCGAEFVFKNYDYRKKFCSMSCAGKYNKNGCRERPVLQQICVECGCSYTLQGKGSSLCKRCRERVCYRKVHPIRAQVVDSRKTLVAGRAVLCACGCGGVIRYEDRRERSAPHYERLEYFCTAIISEDGRGRGYASPFSVHVAVGPR